MTTMSNSRRGLPLTSSRIEKIFPKLTSAQISRIVAHGHVRSVQSGEVLIEQGDKSVPFFVVITGEVEIVRPCGAHETLVTVHGSGEFTGEVNMLSGRRSLIRARAIKPCKVIELDHKQMLTLVQTDAELSDILMRAFILRRVELNSCWCWRHCPRRVSIFGRYAADQRVSDAQWTSVLLYRSRTRS